VSIDTALHSKLLSKNEFWAAGGVLTGESCVAKKGAFYRGRY
jgi:hypothetical protein